MKRNIIIAIAALAIAALAYVTLSHRSAAPGAVHSSSPDLAVAIGSLSGSVTIQETDGSSTAAAEGQTLAAGETIITGADGEASIEFYDSDRVALAPDSTLKIDDASADKAVQSVHLELTAGRLWARVLKLLDTRSSFDVRNNGVVANVRGTAFHVRADAGNLTIDQFDGSLNIGGTATGTLETGFTMSLDTTSPPPEFDQTIFPTPDETRNDPWIRAQLRADQDFVQRVRAVRRALGDMSTLDSVGDEAGPYTLDDPNATHDGYMAVQIIPPDTGPALVTGQTINFTALAIFQDQNGQASSREVTDQAIWQSSDPSILTVEQGSATAVGEGPVTVIARWNDGTHEHSGSIRLTVGASADGNAATSSLSF